MLRLPLLLLLALLAFAPAASAHRLDEYLQATLVVIEPGSIRLQMNLTPGVAVAEPVLSQIDTDHDGVISPAEAATYAESLKRDLLVQLDRRDLPLKLITSDFSTPAELRTGSGMIQFEFSAATDSFAAGAHRLTLRNRHLPGVSVYLFNAGQPNFFNTAQPKSGSIEITAQKRNETQSEGEIEFTFYPPPNSSRAFAIPATLGGLLVAMFAVVWWLGKISPRSI